MENLINSSLLQSEEKVPWRNVDYFGNASSTSLSYSSWGPQRDPLYIVIPITIIYLLILITGTIGNVSTCIVIARNKSMHTATNYYLFSLAISDLLLLIFGLPVEVYLVWSKYSYVFGEVFCIIRGMAAECSTNASVLTITAFTVERYVAICHPFLSHTMSKLSRAIKLILVIWIVALGFAVPMALQFGVVKHELNPDISMCTLKLTLYEHSFEIATLLFFIVPMILITVLYIMIGIKLRQSNMMKQENERNQTNGDSSSNASNVVGTRLKRSCRHYTGRSTTRVLKMLVAVVVAFFICWAPFHVQRLIYIYGTADDHVSSKSKWMEFFYNLVTYISGVLYYVSATINPILYNIMSNKFREAFMETLGTSCCRRSFSGQQEQRSYSSLSRSQQRSFGFFGSRARGSNLQDSTEYSGNSLRDEALLGRSSSLEARAGLPVNLNRNSDPVQRCVRNGNEGFSKSRRSKNGDSSNRLPVIQGHNRDSLSPGGHSEETRQLHEGSYRIARNNRINASHSNRSIRYNQHNQLSDGTIENNETRRKKWWSLFKWLPDAKIFKFNSGRSRHVRPGGPIVNDVESNLEEYSMTSCHIPNAETQRPV